MRSLAAVPALCLLIHAAPATGEPAPHPSDVPTEAILGELPFLASPEPNRIVVDLAPDSSGRPLELLLDTGATFSVFTPRAAQAAGVSVRRLKRDPYRRATRLGREHRRKSILILSDGYPYMYPFAQAAEAEALAAAGRAAEAMGPRLHLQARGRGRAEPSRTAPFSSPVGRSGSFRTGRSTASCRSRPARTRSWSRLAARRAP